MRPKGAGAQQRAATVVAEPPQDGKIEAVYRVESRGVFAALVRLPGDFDLAEEALQDAFLAAVEQWPRDGVPANPRAWLISAGRFEAIDALRRRVRADRSAKELLHRLGLIFTCCHPALSFEAQIALSLREVCGLTTESRLHAPSVQRPLPLRSAWCAPGRKSAMRASCARCRRAASSRPAG